ncbi:TatD family deoxyribonuclease [Peribacillus saganii]|uniref:TatD family deoxyribonuclease n=1 Tax=Peribacillus saganii TaxID=2303992 RepID=A0A372LSK8_9BACI|nr:TatD family hydrolase [Peribacillus saganii]RFU70782.1 TatD family deoxyribonuclease [Peribacillus saganii]
MNKLIDSHIHLDLYNAQEIGLIMKGVEAIEALISVSFDLNSCKRNLELAGTYKKVKPAFGYHPEQPLLDEAEVQKLFRWIHHNHEKMIAVGEVGLPYYSRKKYNIPLEGYIELLENFVKLAKELDMPIVLHAVYEDAPVVCDLLEKHSISRAHFHWFKGDLVTTERIAQNGYFISVTPDIVYEKEIQTLAERFPIEQLMVETDGPWPFEGPFKGQMTHPYMIKESAKVIAQIKGVSIDQAEKQLNINTRLLYAL